MVGALAIARRECASLFRLPAGWVIIALYVFLCGSVFALRTIVPGAPATLRDFFAISGWLLLPVVPAISMRLLSEESRSGTIESLMTSPVSDLAVVLGKYAGACLFFLAMLAPTSVFVVVLFAIGEPDPDLGPIIAGYLSLILQGMLYLAIGTLASSVTANQTLAFLLSLFTILALLMTSSLAVERAPAMVRAVIQAISIDERVRDFSRGVVDLSHVVFFLSGSAVFLTLAIVAVQSRRWR